VVQQQTAAVVLNVRVPLLPRKQPARRMIHLNMRVTKSLVQQQQRLQQELAVNANAAANPTLTLLVLPVQLLVLLSPLYLSLLLPLFPLLVALVAAHPYRYTLPRDRACLREVCCQSTK